MKASRASDLVKGIIVDMDAMLAASPRDLADRHSAAASAAILSVRLLGGACINIARLAAAAERIATTLEDYDRPEDRNAARDGGMGEADDGEPLS